MIQDFDFEIEQGADISVNITLRNTADNTLRDLTGVTPSASMKINKYQDSAVDFTATVSGIPTDGVINLGLTNAQTSLLNTRWKYMYDVNLSYQDSDLNDVIEKVLRGFIKVNPGVTE